MKATRLLSARYGFKEPRTREIQRPDDPLYRAFREWLEGVPEGELDYFESQQEPHYKSALNLIEKVDGIKQKTTEEIQIVLQSYQDDPRIRNAGLFLSAYYNTIVQRDLVWDLDIDTKIDCIGYRLGANKRLVLNADSGDHIGTQSNGLLVNYASVGGNISWGAEAPSVNFGSVGGTMAFEAKAPSVNFGSVGGYMTWGAIAPSINFGSVGEMMAFRAEAPSVNLGSVGKDMALGAHNIQANIAIRNPDGEFYRNGEFCLDESEARQHPRLVKYFEDFKAEGKKYRHAGFPECLGVFDVVERFIGSGTGEELNSQFMRMLIRLLI